MKIYLPKREKNQEREKIIIKSSKKAFKYFIYALLLVMLFLLAYPKKAKAVGTGLLGSVGTLLSSSDLVQVQYSDQATYTYTSNINNLQYDVQTQMTTSEYAWRVKKAFYVWEENTSTGEYEKIWYDIRVSVKPTYIASGTNKMTITKVSNNSGKPYFRFWSEGSEATVKYQLMRNDGQATTYMFKNYAFGFIDPDGADYIFDGVTNTTQLSELGVYYVPASVYSDGNTNYTFENAFRVKSVNSKYGIYIEAGDLNFQNGIIAIDKPANSFSINWSTKRRGVGDMLELPILYYKPSNVRIKFKVNGGYMRTAHGSDYGVNSNGYITKTSGNTTTTVIHTLQYGQSLGSNGLINYNNSSAVNLGRLGYTVDQGSEFNTKSNGKGVSFSQTEVYRGIDFVNYADEEGVVILYVNWKPKEYSVNYILNSGSHSQTPTSYKITDSVITIDDPTRTGYTFLGWQKKVTNLDWKEGFLNYSTGEAETSTTYPNSNYSGCISLKKGVTYTISGYGDYDTTLIRWRLYDGSTYLGSASGLSYTADQDVTNYKARLLFYGESTATQRRNIIVTASSSAPYDKSAKIHMGSTGNITLTAQWQINTSKLTVNPNGGSVSVTSPTGGTAATISTSTTYTQNYNTTLTLGTPTKPNTTNTTTYTISYNGNNGTVGTTNNSNKKSTKTDTTTYTFSSWTKSSTFYGTLATNNKTYTFPANGNVTSTITAAYTSNTSSSTTQITLPNATRTGYTLKGWYTLASGGTKRGDAGGTYTPTASETLYAQWQINSSNVIIDPAGGSTTVYNDNHNIITSMGGIETITSAKTYTGDYLDTLSMSGTTKNPTSSSQNYNITYDGNSGTVGTTTDVNTKATKTDTTTYTFSDWTKNLVNGSWGQTQVSGPGVTVDGYIFGPNVNTTDTLTATYTTSTSSSTTSVTLPNATRTGYTLKGWYTAASGGTKRGNPGETYTPTASETLHAQWTANTATITIRRNGSNWNNSGINVALYQSGTSKYAYADANVPTNAATVSWTVVEAGTYDIYASKDANNLTTLVDTGIDVTVTSSGTATIDYYTLTLNKGVGISAVSGAGTYLKNQTANIDATVSTGYTWQGWSVTSGDSPN